MLSNFKPISKKHTKKTRTPCENNQVKSNVPTTPQKNTNKHPHHSGITCQLITTTTKFTLSINNNNNSKQQQK
eukprot:m.288861 g.288861  ORF g.288861 m.288861 type:complete len:73 (-) comp202290_c0_seq1:10-228(-)